MSFTFRVTSLKYPAMAQLPEKQRAPSTAQHSSARKAPPATATSTAQPVRIARLLQPAMPDARRAQPTTPASTALSRQLATPISTSLRRQPCSKPVNPFFYPAFTSLSRPQLLLSRTHRLNLTVCGESGHAILGFVLEEEAFVATGPCILPMQDSLQQATLCPPALLDAETETNHIWWVDLIYLSEKLSRPVNLT